MQSIHYTPFKKNEKFDLKTFDSNIQKLPRKFCQTHGFSQFYPFSRAVKIPQTKY